MPSYETKVPEKVRNSDAEKIAGYENEINETKKGLTVLEKFL